MKKTLTVIMAFCFMAGWSSAAWSGAALVDDFESYSAGLIGTAAGQVASPPWTAATSQGASASRINQEGVGKVLTVTPFTLLDQTCIVYKTISPIVNTDTVTTLYFRMRPRTATVNSSIGLSAVAAPVPNSWADFSPQVRVSSQAGVFGFDVRNGGAFSTSRYTMTVDQWYNVWVVINQVTDQYNVYLTAGGNASVSGNIVYQLLNAGFRTGTTASLVTCLVSSQGGVGLLNDNRLDIDDINMASGQDLTIPPQLRPYSPAVLQDTPDTNGNIATTLTWKAGADPAGTYAVNPAIVNQYVFMSSGNPTDANMVYVGATGDPGDTNPDSQYGGLIKTVDKTYFWAVVDALPGYAPGTAGRPALTVGVSNLSVVDPNNLISSWSYEATKSKPQLKGTPPLADARVFLSDPSAVLTVTYTSSASSVTGTWYKDGNVITAGGDVSISTNNASSTLTIATPVVGDEGKYYCVVTNVSGSSTTNTALLVIKKTLAQFNFEGNLTDSSGNSALTGIVKAVPSLLDPNEMGATVVGSPSYVPGISGGQAISLNGLQFVDFGTGGYPQAGPLNTIGDIRGTGYEKQGFGRGMDEGSILCWVKLSSAGAVYSNANNNSTPVLDDTHFIMSTNGTTNARILIRGENDDATNTLQALGEANGAYPMTGFDLKDGQWYMFAATWAGNTARIYINGEQVATNSQGSTEIYQAWARANLLGASRTLAARHILESFVTGAIDNLRVYNYAILATDIEAEYETVSGKQACLNQTFTGYLANLDNTASSYCKIDLKDFAVIAQSWLNNGY